MATASARGATLLELLPVIVKLLSLFGKETLYDSILRRSDEGADVDDEAWADRDRDLALLQAKHKFDEEEQRLLSHAAMQQQTSQAVADEQLKIAMNAIKTWSGVAQLRADEALNDWYQANVAHRGGPTSTGPTIGQQVVHGPQQAPHGPARTVQLPVTGDPSATTPIPRYVNGSNHTPNP